MNLTDAVAFVTGGSGGLGANICTALAAEGVHVGVGYRDGLDRARAVCARIDDLGRKSASVCLDQSNATEVDVAIGEVRRELGGLDILINNAGMTYGRHSISPGDLNAFTQEIWDEMMAVNVRGPYLVTRAAAPHLRRSKWGRVVNIGSTLGHGAWYVDRAFAPSKAAVIPLTRFLAAVLAPDVTVNCVSPGLMETTGLGSGGPEHLVQGWRDRAVLGLTTSIEDVTEQVVVLCKSTTTTGQSVVVDGGINFD